MSIQSDWMPRIRSVQLEMGTNWSTILAEKAELWKIPEALTTVLKESVNEAASQLAVPIPERNAVTTARMNDAFKNLSTIMRDIKKRYFYVPPLTNSDIVSLGLKLKDENPTNIPPPSIPVTGRLTFPSIGLVEMCEIRPDGEKSDERSKYGVRIYFGILSEATSTFKYRITAPPKTGDDLPHSVFTRQKRYRFAFSEQGGKEVFFCMRYENSKGEAGPWGKIISAHVP